MKITEVAAWRVAPPDDAWFFLSVATDSGLVGWGEFTGSGHNAAAAAICREAAKGLAGADPLDLDHCLAPYRNFKYPPPRDKITAVAWSSVAQALWDIRGQAFGAPLCALFGAAPKAVPLYANLNRGLFGDRGAAAHARHAELALKAGFVGAKCTPFDEVTPLAQNRERLAKGMERLRAAADAVGSERVSVDCHRRFCPPLARAFLDGLADIGVFRWVEDLLDAPWSGAYPEFRVGRSGVTWAGGENLTHLDAAVEFLTGGERPDVFMPDVKYFCGLDAVLAACRVGEAAGCLVSPHNPSGPISQAFSAHVAATSPGSVVEYPFLSVPDRSALTTPAEPIGDGVYLLSGAPGLGLAPSAGCLEKYGTRLF